MQGLVQYSVGRMWADSCLLWSSSVYLQTLEKAVYSVVNIIISFVLLITALSYSYKSVSGLNKLLGNLVLRPLSLTSALVFRNCYTFHIILLGLLNEHLNCIGILF